MAWSQKSTIPALSAWALALLTRLKDFTMLALPTSRFLLLACLTCAGVAAQAQELQLFEPVESTAPGGQQALVDGDHERRQAAAKALAQWPAS